MEVWALKFIRKKKNKRLWLKIKGDNVELSGIRFQGPHPNINEINNTQGITDDDGYNNLIINNCEISAFSRAGISLKNSNAHIYNNYIHHNRKDSLGYGVILDKSSNALIEKNIFDFNRHDIAGSGHRDQNYEARYNIVLPNGTDHSFDMHSENENENNGSHYAGNNIYIHHNTFMNTNHEAIMIRAIPKQGALIEKNTFYHSTRDNAIKQYLRNGLKTDNWANSRIHFPFQNITLIGNKFNGALNGGNSKDVILLTPDWELKKYIFDNNLFFNKTLPRVGHDFNFADYFVGNWTNNGTSDLLALDDNGAMKLYQFKNGSFYNSTNIGVQVGHDFNFENYFVGNWSANGTDDLIVRNQSGELYLYKFNGATFYGQGNPTQVGHGFNFENYFVGNWTNNGTSDLIARDSNGTLKLYRFNGTTFSSLGVVGNNFNYEDYCVGDFTGDGIDDLLAIDTENSIYLFPFKNNTFYNNGGPIKIGHNLFFDEFLVGQWGG